MADPAAIRYWNPGAMWPGPSATAFGAVGADTLNDGQGNRIARFPDAESGAAAQFDLLKRGYSGMRLADAIKKWSGGNHWLPYTNHVSQNAGLAPDTVLTPDLLNDPTKAIPIARSMAAWEAGRRDQAGRLMPYPMSDEQWGNAHKRYLGGPTAAATASPASAPITTGSIPGRPPMADFSTSGLSPEEVALRRRYGQQAYQAGSDASPVGHWTQALARVVQGANAGVWNSQAQEGETAGRKAMVDAIMSGNPKAVLGTQYGAAMAPQFLEQSIRQSDPMYQENLAATRASNAHNAIMRPIQEEAAVAANKHTQTLNPIQEELARANLKKAQDKDAVQEFIKGIMAPDQGQPAINQPPQMRPMSDKSGEVLSTDPNLIRVQAAQPQAPAQPMTPKGLRDVIKSRPLAEQQMFAMMMGQDPKKAMELLKEWTDPKINKTTEHDLDKGLMGAINSLSRLQEVQKTYKPEFLQGGTQAGINFNTFRDKFLTGKLKPTPQEQAQLSQYHTWRATAWNELNSYIKELAGSAVTGNELERTLRERPNPGVGWMDGDSPAAYEAKLNATMRNGKLAVARYRYLRENGLLKDGEAMAKREDLGQKFPLDQMPKIIDQEGEKTLKRMRMENPGKSDQELLPQAMEEVSKRFGLGV